jgi:uncharacterized membrane protein
MPAQPEKKWIQHKMVGWYDPGQFLHTGVEVVVSALLGTRADYRVVESLTAPQGIFDDYASEPEIWIDYVADLGDGWNSTYTIASLLAAKSLDVPFSEAPGKLYETQQGRILVMGGDEVYPTASRQGYEDRTVGPYECALAESEPPRPSLFAIPGNHDWYDGLVSFSRLFCRGRGIGGWKTRQRRSYFAIQLPHRWWLWGLDIQLESDIDQPQLEYFREAAGQIQEGDRIILATAEPHWIYGNIYDPKLQSNLAYLEEKVIHKAKAKVQVWVAGDIHHYRRHEATDCSQTQLITSGGGGAFLHPTWGPPVDEIRVGPAQATICRLKGEFPSQKISKRLLRRDLAFPFLNPKFGLLTGLLYLFIGYAMGFELQEDLSGLPFTARNIFRALGFGVQGAVGSPASLALVIVLILGFIVFTDIHKKLYRAIAGSLHGMTHLVALVLVGWLVHRVVTHSIIAVTPGSLGGKWVIWTSLFIGGYLAGGIIMGIYLYISLRFFRRHANEAFSALHIPDYKNFVRLHIDREGGLTIFPIGATKVPRKWKPSGSSSASEPQLVPAGGAKITPCLIEPPIKLGPRQG